MKQQKKEKKIPVEIVVCSKCNGNKITENGVECKTCQGVGVFLHVGNGGIYYWDEKLSGFSPILRSISQLIPNLIRAFVYFLVVVTFLYGVYFVIINNPDFFSLLKRDIRDATAFVNGLSPTPDLLVAVTNDQNLNLRLVKHAKAAGCMVYGVDNPAISDFMFPALAKIDDIKIAIITTLPDVAQHVADKLMGAGIKGILNFAPVALRTKNDVFISNVDMACELESLIFFVDQKKIDKKRELERNLSFER